MRNKNKTGLKVKYLQSGRLKITQLNSNKSIIVPFNSLFDTTIIEEVSKALSSIDFVDNHSLIVDNTSGNKWFLFIIDFNQNYFPDYTEMIKKYFDNIKETKS